MGSAKAADLIPSEVTGGKRGNLSAFPQAGSCSFSLQCGFLAPSLVGGSIWPGLPGWRGFHPAYRGSCIRPVELPRQNAHVCLVYILASYTRM